MLPKYVDTDQHVTEPPDFWTGRFSKKFAEREPKFTQHATLGPGWSWDGGKTVRPMGVQSVGSEDPRKIGNFKTFEEIDPGCYDPRKRLEVMDIDGAQAALLFPNAGGFFHAVPGDDFYLDCARAYNDALMDWAVAGDAKRLIPGAILPMLNVQSAVTEMERVAKKGYKHLIANRWPSAASMPNASDDAYWAAAQDLGLVISVHGFGNGRINTPMVAPDPKTLKAGTKGNVLAGSMTQEMTAAHRGAGLGCTQPLAAFILSGVLERSPKLKVALIETSLGWLPYFAEQLDAIYLRQRWLDNAPKLKQLPSEYLTSIYANFDREWLGVKYRSNHIGANHMFFGTDYPHIGNFYPHSRFYIELVMQGVPAEEQEQILWSNAANLYHLEA